ncbi:MAG TPA: N,N-dimethylformamidase beta subunit family domain-containing protein, partial [Anaerolineales bacterium]|nr:N,N-dimethylformamidase beta subunit family domain-containing protein [Anaerolineales bacterium]
MKTIMGYSDQISVCPGETIKFMVSCEGEKSYRARLVQIIHGDTSPAGPGYKERAIKSDFERDYKARKQVVYAGSHAVVPSNKHFDQLKSFTVQAYAWPTTPEKGQQTLISVWNPSSRGGFIFGIDEKGGLSLTLGNGAGGTETISTGKKLLAREWCLVAASYDAERKEVCLHQQPVVRYARVDTAAQVTQTAKVAPVCSGAPLLFAATPAGEGNGRVVGRDHYNGKIDSPRLIARALGEADIQRISGTSLPAHLVSSTVAAWDFSREMSSERIIDMSPNLLHGDTVNLPARAMKGHNWTGEEMCWRHKPEHYGAIHFHDDDLYDSGWEVDFQFTVPKGLKSGLYAAHISNGRDEDFIPFVIRPERGTKTSDLVFVIPTASYMAYANEHMMTDAPLAEHLTDQVVVMQPTDVYLHEHREYGASCYDSHSDGSGVCYTSRLRPILTMRPKYQSWLGGKGSSLWQMNADTHITDWLESNG